MGRGGGWSRIHYAYLAEAMLAARGGGPSVLRRVHRDGMVVIERVDALPVLVCKHRMVHDASGWHVRMHEGRLSRDALTMVRE
jgi:hypothetical protein